METQVNKHSWRDIQFVEDKVESIWKEDPVGFKEWVESPLYSNHPALSPVQYHEIYRLIGDDPKKIFTSERKVREAVWLWGRGCLAFYEQIVDEVTKELHNIRTWSKLNRGINIKSYDAVNKEIHVVKSGVPFCKGIKKVYRVKFKSIGQGTINKATYCAMSHVFYTQSGWKQLRDISVGDIVYVERRPVGKEGNVLLAEMEVKSIEYVGEEEIYDLEVPIYHNYFTPNGMLHHNSGKGTCATLLESYLSYVLLCLSNPHRYFGVAEEDPLDLVNVAVNGIQARRLFDRFSKRIQSNGWFKNKYKFKIENRTTWDTEKVASEMDTIKFLGSQIIFPNNLRALALHARNQAWADLTVISFICDEFSGFMSEKEMYNSDQIYDTLTTGTRELPYVGLITSFPRLSEDVDATFLKLQEAEKSKYMVGSRYKTWDVKPERFYSGEMFDFVSDSKTREILKVPVEYEKQFTNDPENAKAKYAVIMSAVPGDYFEYGESLSVIVTNTAPRIITSDAFIGIGDKVFVRKNIVSAIKDSIPRVIGLDQAEVECDLSLCIAHRENMEGFEKVIIDGFIVWHPDKEKRAIVDVENLGEIIKTLSTYFTIQEVRMDHWNSSSLEQMLIKQHFRKVVVTNASMTSYGKMKQLIYSSLLTLPNQPESMEAVKQCKNLKNKPPSKPKVITGHQDIVDSLAHVCDMLYGEDTKPRRLPAGAVVGSVGIPQAGAMQDKGVMEQFFNLRQPPIDVSTMKNIIPGKGGNRRLPVGGFVGGGGTVKRRLEKLKREGKI